MAERQSTSLSSLEAPLYVPNPGWCEPNSSLQPMSDSRRASLNSLLPQLETRLLVSNFLCSIHGDTAQGFLTDRETEDIKSQTSNSRRVSKLFEILKGKDNAAFDNFCAILESAGYGHWARSLLQKAGLDCTDVHDSLSLPLTKLNDALLKKTELFVPGEKALENKFIDLTADFEEYVLDLPDKKFLKFRRICAGCLRKYHPSGSVSPAPTLPESQVPLLDYLNNQWNFIDIRLLSDLVDFSGQPNLKAKLDEYKIPLETFSNQCLSCLETRVHKIIHMPIDNGEPMPNAECHIVATILSRNPTLKEIYNVRAFLIDSLHLEDAKFLGFDSGCTVLFFSVTCAGTSPNPRSLSVHMLAQLKEFSVARMVCLGAWALEIAAYHSSTPEQSLLIFKEQSSNSEKVSKADFDDIVQAVRELKDDVVTLKLELWQMKRNAAMKELDDHDLQMSTSHSTKKDKSLAVRSNNKKTIQPSLSQGGTGDRQKKRFGRFFTRSSMTTKNKQANTSKSTKPSDGDQSSADAKVFRIRRLHRSPRNVKAASSNPVPETSSTIIADENQVIRTQNSSISRRNIGEASPDAVPVRRRGRVRPSTATESDEMSFYSSDLGPS